MKSIANYINEALKLGNKSRYKYHPETKEELQDLLNQLLKERGNEGDFNDIDTSKITDMSYLFYELTDFNGNISQWDVSKKWESVKYTAIQSSLLDDGSFVSKHVYK